jgi:hypothetical protein
MRRLALAAVALACLASFTVTGSVGAASKVQAKPILPPVTHRGISNGEITVGSQWTYYDWSLIGLTGFCEVLSFGGSHIFTGDLGDVGHWSGNISLKFTGSSGIFTAGDAYKAKYYSNLFGVTSNPAGFDGVLTYTSAKYPFAVGLLISGNDPEALGTC